MSFVNRVWKDRQVERPDRWKFTDDNETEVKYYTIERAEGTIDVIGDSIDAENMNDLEARVSSAFLAEEQSRTTLQNNVNASLATTTEQMTTAQNLLRTQMTEAMEQMSDDMGADIEELQQQMQDMYTWNPVSQTLTIHLS